MAVETLSVVVVAGLSGLTYIGARVWVWYTMADIGAVCAEMAIQAEKPRTGYTVDLGVRK